MVINNEQTLKNSTHSLNVMQFHDLKERRKLALQVYLMQRFIEAGEILKGLIKPYLNHIAKVDRETPYSVEKVSEIQATRERLLSLTKIDPEALDYLVAVFIQNFKVKYRNQGPDFPTPRIYVGIFGTHIATDKVKNVQAEKDFWKYKDRGDFVLMEGYWRKGRFARLESPGEGIQQEVLEAGRNSFERAASLGYRLETSSKTLAQRCEAVADNFDPAIELMGALHLHFELESNT